MEGSARNAGKSNQREVFDSQSWDAPVERQRFKAVFHSVVNLTFVLEKGTFMGLAISII